MSLVVEDGSGKTTAESYISVADATTYHANHGNPSAWSSATEAEQEEALRIATQYLDAVYGLRWLGTRSSLTQRLDWPRYNVTNSDGDYLDDTELPRQLAEATAVLGLKHLTETNGVLPDVSNNGTVKRKKVAVGPITEETEYMGGLNPLKRYTLAEMLISRLLQPETIRRM